MEVGMRSVGVRELKSRTSQVLRLVRASGEEIEITHHGQVIARLVPVPQGRRPPRRPAAAWASLDRVAREIGARWPRGRSAVEAVREGRRDLR
jgi:prevent-host-death family protein